ncbi:PTS system maltose-specific IIB component, Glc family (TC 4.A.1.1.8)/PTS system maltose-specific IIC component, Glc family (TC 4.A.1.1.8) [Lactobacillus bombicola]|uniref:PTS system maltose-specific IIB component, Glc family (TC 4.A.1.1.8)/PTS system maltose-specific IIC component, Glc family (TC 4.A.1.1.8) n=1 Tax=Lactobacillus bombicola TaxID=1505723 RepID=A0A1I1RUP2_9LACO|nr:alpha-glucoside-specific PTS transporter subunit IIBC [Lactobacillus bombicola]MCO6527445.1 PTS transporter subunit EIIC [Lactobacillus sp.]SFD37971.1 PTS system maltose-specific IIB component, Glc family (TC 4.A.1.1.8)/PTS system maltose-specific IIC component, Glc family (TC 4.A.1.1.8) [Lactobacillus bombicola]
MMQKFQKFGAAMFVPVLLFSFAGIVVALGSLFTNQQVLGSLANPGTTWNSIWDTISAGGWTVFKQEALLFVVGLPIGLANKSKGRAAMESVITYMTYNYFIGAILTHWGKNFGIPNFAKVQLIENSTNYGLTEIAGIKTLDTSIIGALIVAGIVIWLHNRYFDKKLPEWLGTFQGSTYVYILGFFIMIPVAVLTCWGWPKVQLGIGGIQQFIVKSGVIGVWIYNFLNRVLIPTGLHHLVYIPFQYGPAVVAGGLQPYWLQHLSQFALSTHPLKQLAPAMGFQLYGNEKVFLAPIICLAFYATAKKSKKKQTSALLIPAALTSFFAGITEPIDFTYLFAAPILWIIYSIIAATMNTVMFSLGVVGNFSGGAIDMAAENWIPLWNHHWQTFLIQFIVGIIFAIITFFIFKFMIKKFNYITPGREDDDQEVQLLNKKEYQNRKNLQSQNFDNNKTESNPYIDRAIAFLDLLGGDENIKELSSCATRLRVSVKDPEKLGTDAQFKAAKAISVVHHGKAIQVIVGLDVAQVLEAMQELRKKNQDNSSHN